MQAALMDAAPLGKTGETRRQIQVVPESSGGTTFGFRATAPTKQGEYVEKGTQPHEIRPIRGKALRFAAGGTRISQPSPNQRIRTHPGAVVFAKVVFHPGMPARPWFEPVIARWSVFLEQALAAA
jgi:hypothetical protein